MTMGVPLENFEWRADTQNAIEKARREKPWIKKVMWEDGPIKRRVYRVRGRTKKTSGERHEVELWADRDDQRFAICSCRAGTPPVDPATGIFKYEPRTCYHVAAAYFHHQSLMRRLAAKRLREQNQAEAARAELFGDVAA
jgi:hypothetical protein